MTAEIKYLFGNLATREITAELPLSSVAIDKKMNDIGNFRANFKLDSSGFDNTDVLNATTPGACFVIMERDDTVIWEGIVWTRAYQSQAKDVELTARTYESYADRQFILTNFERTDVEQRNIFIDLWNDLQSTSERNIGVSIPSSFPTLVTKTLTVQASEYKTYFQALSTIADGDNGFDWTIDTYKESNIYRRRVLIGYPKLGTTDAAGLSFDYPGAITNYYQTESMSNAGTHLFIIGAGEGDSMVVGTATQDAILAGGFKRYDVSISRKDITDQSLANSIAAQMGILRRPPMTFIKIFLKGDIEPVFGSYGLGDTATLSIIDPRHPNGMTVDARIVAFSYKPPSNDSIEEVELIFEGDELNG